jgi:ankyrin repeat protein
MKASRAGHLCTVQFLICKGADVNRTTTNNDHTPLSLACAGGHLTVVELLLQHGADPYHKLKVTHWDPLCQRPGKHFYAVSSCPSDLKIDHFNYQQTFFI